MVEISPRLDRQTCILSSTRRTTPTSFHRSSPSASSSQHTTSRVHHHWCLPSRSSESFLNRKPKALITRVLGFCKKGGFTMMRLPNPKMNKDNHSGTRRGCCPECGKHIQLR